MNDVGLQTTEADVSYEPGLTLIVYNPDGLLGPAPFTWEGGATFREVGRWVDLFENVVHVLHGERVVWEGLFREHICANADITVIVPREWAT